MGYGATRKGNYADYPAASPLVAGLFIPINRAYPVYTHTH